MTCPEALQTLKDIYSKISRLVSLRPSTVSVYDTSCSSISTTLKGLLADDTTLPDGAEFSRITIKVRSMGTNTFIAFGVTSQSFRLTSVGDSFTFIAPMINGTVIPFLGKKIQVVGDGATGVLEITGIRMYGEQL